MKVVTWNLHDNAKLANLGKISPKGQVLCLQEIFGGIKTKKNWNLVKHGDYYIGQTKLDHVEWDVIYWDNDMTKNNTMGLAILYRQDERLKILDKGVITFNSTEGGKSERRGLPWIKVKEVGNADVILFSYHSSSASDSTDHANKVLRLMNSMMEQTNQATFGDFNLNKSYFEPRVEYPLKLVAGNVPTRPSSGRNIDYCVCKNGLQVTYEETLSSYMSDHRPVVFSVLRQ